MTSPARNIHAKRGFTTLGFTANMQQNVTLDEPRKGRSRGCGRPWRGRGHGNWRRNAPGQQNSSNPSENSEQKREPRPKLTHFISIPLGHLPAVRSAAESFRSALLEHTPPISGLDPTIIVSPRRLHLTLGVMSLEEEISAAQYYSNEGMKGLKTVSSALNLLRSLRPSILDALGGQPLRVPLTSMGVLKPERGDETRAHVLFTGPTEDDLRAVDGQRLRHVSEIINSEFIKAGLIVDDGRPLKLHCTLVNTSHRKTNGNSRNKQRIPFSFAEICGLPAVQALAALDTPAVSYPQPAGAVTQLVGTTETVTVNAENQSSASSSVVAERVTRVKARSYVVPVNLGTHKVSEVQICRMGSWGPEGEYVCVGKIDL